jgi:CRP/FNR family transcriptional regulator
LALDEEELAAVTEIRSAVELDRHQSLFIEGDPAQHLFTVTDGVMRIYKLLPDGRRQITGFLYPGDFLGLPDNEAYAYSAEALCDVALCRYPRDKLVALLKRFPKMEHRLLAFERHELAAAQDQVMLLGRKTARERVASFLVTMSERAAQRGQPDNTISLPMTRNEVGDYLGLTTETVSRTVSHLKREGIIITLQHGDIEITERERLREIAEGD